MTSLVMPFTLYTEEGEEPDKYVPMSGRWWPNPATLRLLSGKVPVSTAKGGEGFLEGWPILHGAGYVSKFSTSEQENKHIWHGGHVVRWSHAVSRFMASNQSQTVPVVQVSSDDTIDMLVINGSSTLEIDVREMANRAAALTGLLIGGWVEVVSTVVAREFVYSQYSSLRYREETCFFTTFWLREARPARECGMCRNHFREMMSIPDQREELFSRYLEIEEQCLWCKK